MQKLINLVNFLNDPHLVTKTQNHFSLSLIDVISDEECNQQDKFKSTSLKHVKSVNHLNNTKCLYLVGNYFYYWFFLFITNIGNEVFYISFLPFVTWNYDDKVMILTCMAWAISMYIGQALKDILKMPRPSSPPVAKIEDRYLHEYGFPSTHAMAVFTISWTLLTLVFRTLPQEETITLRWTISLLSYVLIFLVCLSRIYLGMHTYLDICGGLVLAYAINRIFIYFSSSVYNLIHDSFVGGAVFSSLFLLVCFVYPNKKRWSSARADTFLIMGVGTGLSFGMTCKAALQIESVGKLKFNNREINELSLISLVLLRTFIGLLLLVGIRLLCKELFYLGLRKCLNLSDNTTRSGIKEIIKNNYKIEIAYNFFVYASISFSSIFNAFLIFSYFNLI
ncbi:sphingosine-1-phosphate phosphatase 2 [Brachionus plicatilis]|uniref:Sphingosine-1-phosphate phosphatase 2 n=1 Tax=Brachionus plicatilis TaxID=10195 RepID=A0A3M7SS28_BRAPC|nr:sphingosine-1-phosphate phosphatase 2 [Brachionus plicatilis]